MSEFVKCCFCGKEIGYGWKLERSRDRPPLYLCDDCYDVIAAATLTQFPMHLRDVADFATGKQWDEEEHSRFIFKYFELGAKEESEKHG